VGMSDRVAEVVDTIHNEISKRSQTLKSYETNLSLHLLVLFYFPFEQMFQWNVHRALITTLFSHH